jgi:hypothetical protein
MLQSLSAPAVSTASASLRREGKSSLISTYFQFRGDPLTQDALTGPGRSAYEVDHINPPVGLSCSREICNEWHELARKESNKFVKFV